VNTRIDEYEVCIIGACPAKQGQSDERMHTSTRKRTCIHTHTRKRTSTQMPVQDVTPIVDAELRAMPPPPGSPLGTVSPELCAVAAEAAEYSNMEGGMQVCTHAPGCLLWLLRLCACSCVHS